MSLVSAAEDHSSMPNHKHSMKSKAIPLTEAGNDAFGTIQEVIKKLNSNPDTDWSKVNIEALRRHLVDMHDMVYDVKVISQKPVKHGLKVIMRPTTRRAARALPRVFKAHPAQLQRETGWRMVVKKSSRRYILTITSQKAEDVNKIRGLGYIGVMAYGSHHQVHHWAMPTGSNPHHMHH